MEENNIDEQETDEARYELTDMVVETVGLVPKGANRQSFFLLKNLDEEAEMTQTIDIEEVVPEDAPEEVKGILKQVGDGIASLFQKAQAEPESTEGDDQSEATPEPETVEPPPDPEPAPEPDPETAPADGLEKLLKAHTEKFEALLKAQKAEFDAQVTGLKTDLEKANERAEKAERYADEQTEMAEKQAAVQKALAYKALPSSPAALGEMLYTLEKALEPEEFGKVEALLKAADKQAFTAGLFSEFGTARTPEEVSLEAKVEKIQKDQNLTYEKALLSLPEQEQLQLLGEVDNG